MGDAGPPTSSRRTVLKSTALLGASALGVNGLSTGTASGDASGTLPDSGWPVFGSDLGNSGVGPAGISATYMDRSWLKRVDGGGFLASPVVANGVVYAVRGGGSLLAIEVETGETIWENDRYSLCFSSPAVADGTVYLTTVDQTVALDAATGEPKWSADIGGLGSPTVVEDTLYVTGEPGGWDGENDYADNWGPKTVAALSIADGSEQWRATADRMVDTSPAVADGRLVVGGEGLVTAFDAETGDRQWTVDRSGGDTESDDGYTTTVSLVDGTVYGQTTGGVFALDAATGEAVWTRDDTREPGTAGTTISAGLGWDGAGLERVAVTEDSVFATVRDPEDRYTASLYALDRETGETRWTFGGSTLGAAYSSVQNCPTVADGLVYVVGKSGSDDDSYPNPETVYALDPADGSIAKAYHGLNGVGTAGDGGAEVEAPVTVVDGTVFVASYLANGLASFFLAALEGTDDLELPAPDVTVETTDDEYTRCSSVEFHANLEDFDRDNYDKTLVRWFVDDEYVLTSFATYEAAGSGMPRFDLEAGEHTVKAVAYDWWDRRDTDSMTITVSEDCEDDETVGVGIEVATEDPTVGEAVRFEATVDGDDDDLAYDWESACAEQIGDDGEVVRFEWSDPGEYDVSLIATDTETDEEYTASTTVDVDG
ncbi:PQQ-binding-like beta-propeller repeat protein [Haloarchaeobius sp. HME9146]|uniref:outer membrane protein assembly factor BamB family protein n=1 Tax=Haloarchaeobius sp. HME9146 TaxID=2978732 RepID=UPI0021C1F527|nr:PQQ-binding-like beta-propeller repeat protein [Haloarchaeobius sp. HME9146]MCT9095639.1 PQQ-binding-like beta-propeller repeat protein [Haloarchaeobius sp. HME9146]